MGDGSGTLRSVCGFSLTSEWDLNIVVVHNKFRNDDFNGLGIGDAFRRQSASAQAGMSFPLVLRRD